MLGVAAGVVPGVAGGVSGLPEAPGGLAAGVPGFAAPPVLGVAAGVLGVADGGLGDVVGELAPGVAGVPGDATGVLGVAIGVLGDVAARGVGVAMGAAGNAGCKTPTEGDGVEALLKPGHLPQVIWQYPCGSPGAGVTNIGLVQLPNSLCIREKVSSESAGILRWGRSKQKAVHIRAWLCGHDGLLPKA